MRKFSLITLIAVLALALVFVSGEAMANYEYQDNYEDGRYRGSFYDKGEIDISLQFYLEDNTIVDPSIRHMSWDGVDYSASYLKSVKQLADQYKEALAYLDGKDVTAIDDLRDPGSIITETPETVDGYTGATINSAKLISACKDALNRGKYDK